MNDDLQRVIQEADGFIKNGEFDRAWKLLLPYQQDPTARKRLLWLKQKRQEASQGGQQQAKPKSRSRYPLYFLGILVIGIGLVLVAINGLSQREAIQPTAVTDSSQAVSETTVPATDVPVATQVPPTENPPEAGLQQQVREWFLTVEGVKEVMSLDIDLPDGEPPLVFAEIAVDAGYNNSHIPETLVQKLNEELNTTQYSDFMIILNDDAQIVEYVLHSDSVGWEQTVLASTAS